MEKQHITVSGRKQKNDYLFEVSALVMITDFDASASHISKSL